jgi:ABC-type transport system substrate-binding protein
LLDIRVRKALAMMVDKQGLNDGLFEGQSPFFSDVPFVPMSVDYFSKIEPSAVKYPYDPSQAQALLTQAGFTRGADGSWSDASGKLSFDFTTTSGSQNESELSIMAAGWRAQGLEINESIFPVALAQDQQARSNFPSLMTISMPQGVDTLSQYNTGAIPRAETRWVGFNRGGWSNPEFDRVAETFTSTLDPDRRVQLLGQMERTFTEDMASIPLFFNAIPLVAVGAVKGPQNVAPASDIAWDIHNWTY